MNVYFIRHGQSEGNRMKLHCGWSQMPLSELGHRQARRANGYLRNIPFDRIYSSDLRRAIQTAQDALPGCTPICSEKLREVSSGSLTGLSLAECDERLGEIHRLRVRTQDFSAYGGETPEQTRGRLYSFFRELETLKNAENVAVFCHEGTIHHMLAYVLGQHVMLENIRVENASASMFSYSGGCWKLVKWNYTGALQRSEKEEA